VANSISFRTNRFYVSKEDENPVNPIYGQSLILWLKGNLPDELAITDPETEDWGWYSYVTWKKRRYLIGASSDDGEYWVFQAEKQRTMFETLTGREKMQPDDPCLSYFHGLLSTEADFYDVQVS